MTDYKLAPNLQQIVTDALVGMVSGATQMVPPTDKPLPDFIQAPIDRAVTRIRSEIDLHAAAAPAVRGESVAWLVTGPYEKAAFAYKETAEKYCAGLNMGYGEEAYKIRELYAAPQPAEQQPEPDVSALVEALEYALDTLEQAEINMFHNAIEFGRAALAPYRKGGDV